MKHFPYNKIRKTGLLSKFSTNEYLQLQYNLSVVNIERTFKKRPLSRSVHF